MVEPNKGDVVPVGQVTDGTNIWPLSATYYVQNYGVGIDEKLLSSIKDKNYQCPEVSDAQLTEARRYLRAQSAQSLEAEQSYESEPGLDPFRQ